MLQFLSADPLQIEAMTYQLTEKVFVRIEQSEFFSIEGGLGKFQLPEKIRREFMFADGTKIEGQNLPTFEIEIDRESLTILEKPIDPEFFRIPKSNARFLKDSDLGVIVDLNRGVKQ